MLWCAYTVKWLNQVIQHVHYLTYFVIYSWQEHWKSILLEIDMLWMQKAGNSILRSLNGQGTRGPTIYFLHKDVTSLN